MSIRITAAGLALITDHGRHHQHLGVPAAGAFHADRARIAAALVNQPDTQPVLELLVGALELTTTAPVLVAAHGGTARAWLNGVVTAVSQNLLVNPGDRFTVDHDPTRPADGPVYLAVRGLTVPTVLGSASTDTLSGLGPAPLRAGDILDVADEPLHDLQTDLGRFTTLNVERPVRVIRVIAGPHDLDIAGQVWTVDAAARSGVRLTGSPVPGATASLPSLPVLPGTIQVPPSGQPIILGPDCGTTGGYPVAAVVATVDLPLLSRMTPGTHIVFDVVTVEEAHRAHTAHTARVSHSTLHSALLGV